MTTAQKAAGLSLQPAENERKSWLKRFMAFITGSRVVAVDADAGDTRKGKDGRIVGKLTPDMIRRMDEPPKLINPSGDSSGCVSKHRPPSRSMIPMDYEQAFTPTKEPFEEYLSNSQGCRPSPSLDIKSKKYVTSLIHRSYNFSQQRFADVYRILAQLPAVCPVSIL